MREIHVLRTAEGERGAAARLQADGGGAAQCGGVVGPGARGVDDGPRADLPAIGQGQRPDIVLESGAHQFGVVVQHGALAAHAAQKALVQRMHVDIARIGFLDRAAQLVFAQAGHALDGLAGVDQGHVWRLAVEVFEGVLQQILLIRRPDVQHAARAEERMLAEALRRMLVERAAGARKRLDLRGAVGLHEHGRGSTGRVITGFQHRHGRRGAQAVGHGGAGDARADHGKIV